MNLLGLKPLHVVTYASQVAKRLRMKPISRGHFTRIRYGKSQPTEGMILLIVTTLREMTGLAVGAAQLFRVEPAPTVVAIELLSGRAPCRSGRETPSHQLARLYDEHAALLRATAKLRYRIPPEDVDELLHDVFASYLERQPRIDDIRAYLFGATNHACKYYWRKRAHEEPLLAEHEQPNDDSARERADRWAEHLTLGVTLARLGEKCRETFRRFYMEDESNGRIADDLRTTPAYVSQLLYICRKLLALFMQADGDAAMNHPDDLLQYAENPESIADRRGVEHHLAECARCSDAVAFERRFEALLRDPLPWKIAEEYEANPEAPITLLELANTIAAERSQAFAMLQELVVSPVVFRQAQVDGKVQYHTSGVVYALSVIAASVRNAQPQFALLLAETACQIGMKLASRGKLLSHGLLGIAWTEVAVALSLIGRFRDAEQATSRAEAAYENDPRSTAHDLAMVWLTQSAICVETDRLREAEALANAAARQFANYGDMPRYVRALLASGNVLWMRQRYDEAAHTLKKVVAQARVLDDPVTLLCSLQSLGEAYAALDDFDRARECFFEAITIAAERQCDSDHIRATWSLGNVLLRSGDPAQAAEHFREVIRAFDALGIINDAVLARQQLGEALLLLGHVDEARQVLRNAS